jgi:Ser-tRNA(Ala) deacylase AlaX
MINLALKYPYLAELETRITACCSLSKGRIGVQCEESMLRSAAGGQPCDLGKLVCDSNELHILKVIDRGIGDPWLVLPAPPDSSIRPGQTVLLRLDKERRRLLSRGHSALHLLMAAISCHSRQYKTTGATIAEDAGSATLRFWIDPPLDHSRLVAVTQMIRSEISAGHRILTDYWSKIESAEIAYPYWRDDPDPAAPGSVRVIHIEGIDATICAGTHVRTTTEIGSFILTGPRRGTHGHHELDLRLGQSWNHWYAEAW